MNKRKQIVFLIILIGFILTGIARGMADEIIVTFGWDANTEPDLAGYALYQRLEDELYNYDEPVVMIPAAANEEKTCEKVLDQSGMYYWVLRSFDANGNYSEDSNEVFLRIDLSSPGAPQNFTIKSFINSQ